MDELLSMVDNHAEARKENKENKKTKHEAERTAGEEIRNAALGNMIRREALTDITTLNGATSREKAGQR